MDIFNIPKIQDNQFLGGIFINIDSHKIRINPIPILTIRREYGIERKLEIL